MKAILTGGTGMVGSLVLKHCIESDQITEIISFVRSPGTVKNVKLKEYVLSDFSDYSAHAEDFQNVDAAFFCMGAYTGQVDDASFKRITLDFPLRFAEILQRHSPSARLCLLSGAGADRTEKSRTPFARYKGQAENALSKLGLDFYAFRPAYIYPVIPRIEPNWMYRLLRRLYPVLRLLGEYYSIPSTELAAAMFKVGVQGSALKTLENRDILAHR